MKDEILHYLEEMGIKPESVDRKEVEEAVMVALFFCKGQG